VRPPVVMDTNVAIVANFRTPQASDGCVEACIAALLEIRERRRILLDEDGQILEEYRRYLSPSGQPGAGDAFFKWLWSNQVNPEHCRQVRGGEFPDDPDLARFDRSDRKFVVVAIASGERPPVLNATDSDWWEHRDALSRHGVEIHFLCPELMNRR
jgi:hypothetical protein